jgi:hypothetical protein
MWCEVPRSKVVFVILVILLHMEGRAANNTGFSPELETEGGLSGWILKLLSVLVNFLFLK